MTAKRSDVVIFFGAASRVRAIVQAWYPGQAGTRAIAEVLVGAVNPSGRLRWFAKTGATPMYAFGHGLSYTTFAYSDLGDRARRPSPSPVSTYLSCTSPRRPVISGRGSSASNVCRFSPASHLG